jgi:hypothetical protein
MFMRARNFKSILFPILFLFFNLSSATAASGHFLCMVLHVPASGNGIEISAIRVFSKKNDCGAFGMNIGGKTDSYFLKLRDSNGSELSSTTVNYAVGGILSEHGLGKLEDTQKRVRVPLAEAPKGPKTFEVENQAGKVLYKQDIGSIFANIFFFGSTSSVFRDELKIGDVATEFKNQKINAHEAIKLLLSKLDNCKSAVKAAGFLGTCEGVKSDGSFVLENL